MNKTNDCKAIHETTLKTLIDIWDRKSLKFAAVKLLIL